MARIVESDDRSVTVAVTEIDWTNFGGSSLLKLTAVEAKELLDALEDYFLE